MGWQRGQSNTMSAKYIVRGIPFGRGSATDITIVDGRIAQMQPVGHGKADFGHEEALISPTLVDIQVNGIKGIDLQSSDLTPDDVRQMSAILAQWGVGRWAPTLVTGPLDRMRRACETIAAARRADPRVAKAIPGIHLEGPCISPEDGARGAHALAHVRPPSIKEFNPLYAAAEGAILYTTIAPEIPGALPYIRALVRRGIVVSLGHHHASAHDIQQAVKAGASLCTHLGNGIASTINRHINPLWPQLAEDALAASFIPDLEHLPPDALKACIRAKGPGRTILTSDAIHVALLPPGVYDLGGVPIELCKSGRVCLKGTDYLGGSTLMLLQGLANVVQHAAISWQQAIACATRNPERELHIPALPTLRTGFIADMVVFEMRAHGRVHIDAAFRNGALMPSCNG